MAGRWASHAPRKRSIASGQFGRVPHRLHRRLTGPPFLRQRKAAVPHFRHRERLQSADPLRIPVYDRARDRSGIVLTIARNNRREARPIGGPAGIGNNVQANARVVERDRRNRAHRNDGASFPRSRNGKTNVRSRASHNGGKTDPRQAMGGRPRAPASRSVSEKVQLRGVGGTAQSLAAAPCLALGLALGPAPSGASAPEKRGHHDRKARRRVAASGHLRAAFHPGGTKDKHGDPSGDAPARNGEPDPEETEAYLRPEKKAHSRRGA